MEKEVVWFLKFGRKCDLEKLCDGDIYTNNGEYFKNLEEKIVKKKCIGDDCENQLLFKTTNLKMIDRKENVFLDIPSLTSAKIEFKGDKKKAMFCLYSIYEDDFIFDAEKEKYILSLSKEKKEYILKNFIDGERDSVLLIPARILILAIENAASKERIEVIHDSVKYYKEGKPYDKTYEDFNRGSLKRFFWKRDLFENQYEYRFVFGKEINKGQVLLNIGKYFTNIKPLLVDDFINKYSIEFSR